MEQVEGRLRSLRLRRKREIQEEKQKKIWHKIRHKMIRQVRRNFLHLTLKQDEKLGVSCIPYVIVNKVISPCQWERIKQGTLRPDQGLGLQRCIKTKYIWRNNMKRCELRFYDAMKNCELLFVTPLRIPLPEDK